MFSQNSDAICGLITLVMVVLLARRLGHDWEPAGKLLGVAASLFFGAMILRSLPGLYTDVREAQATFSAGGTWAVAVGFMATVTATMIIGRTRV